MIGLDVLVLSRNGNGYDLAGTYGAAEVTAGAPLSAHRVRELVPSFPHAEIVVDLPDGDPLAALARTPLAGVLTVATAHTELDGLAARHGLPPPGASPPRPDGSAAGCPWSWTSRRGPGPAPPCAPNRSGTGTSGAPYSTSGPPGGPGERPGRRRGGRGSQSDADREDDHMTEGLTDALAKATARDTHPDGLERAALGLPECEDTTEDGSAT